LKDISKIVETLKVEFDKHSPEILTGLGLTGLIGSVIFSVRATAKAVRAVDEKKKELKKEKLAVNEVLSTTWKFYIPTIISAVSGSICIVCATSTNTRRNAALAAAYSISETALNEYKEKTKELVGENKSEAIETSIQKDKIQNNPPRTSEVIITGKGETLFKETISGRYFKSDIEKVRRAENELNREMRNSMEISVNDVFVILGLPMTGSVNDDIGWDIDHGYIEFKPVPIMTEDGQACIALDYAILPRPLGRFA